MKMMKILSYNIFRILVFLLSIISPFYCFSLTPKWVGNTPHALNDTYMFVEVISYGQNVNVARMNAIHELALNNELAKAATVSVESGMLSREKSKIDASGKEKNTLSETFDLKVEVKGQNYEVQAKKIDEYAERYHHDEIKLYSLYMVALTNNPIYDQTYLTDSYGVAPAFMSIIPGVGQWYKGSKVKGTMMFLGGAATVTGVIVFENQRAVYHNKMIEQPKFAKEYNNKARNCEIGRNVCIGVAAGVWIYSIVDAIVAPGARRLIVESGKKGGLSLMPSFTPECAGVSLAYSF